jgi:ABC-2 type transport system ATP-binding protein
MKQAIFTHDLTKKYDKTIAVNHIDLQVNHGQIFTLLGPNGAGKTTLIRILSTLLEPNSGNATIMSHDLKKEPEKVRETIGVVRQFSGSDKFLTVWDVLDFYAKIFKVPSKERKQKILHSLKIVGLEEQKDNIVMTLSGGQQRRLAIARTFLHTPKVFFLDEPTSGLDPVAKREIWKQIQLLNKNLNATILLTTHDMHEAEQLSHHIAIMNKGKIIVQGSLQELKSRTRGKNVIKISGKGFTEKALEELEKAPTIDEVRKVEWNEDRTQSALDSEKIRKIRIYVDNIEQTLPHSLEILFKHRVCVNQVQVKEVTLEDIFLKWTGRTLGEQE